jgi:hypothetical protein
MTVKKEAAQASKKNSVKKEAAQASKKNSVKKEEVREVKQVSNTQRCADMIMSLARDAKHTRQEIVQTVSDALSALSIVTVKTMLSDLQNSKYARRYSTHTIAVNKETKIVTVANEIK